MYIAYLLIMIPIQMVYTEGNEKRLTDTNISFTDEKQSVGLYANTLENIQNVRAGNIDYISYHSAIVHLSKKRDQNVALVVESSCTSDEIVKLMSKLKMVEKSVFCYQLKLEEYNAKEIDLFLLKNEVFMVVLFLPWYSLYEFLKEMSRLRVVQLTYVTMAMEPSVLQQLRDDRIFLKISNLVTASSTNRVFENRLLPRIMSLKNPPCLWMPQEAAEMQQNIVLNCIENPVKSIRVVSLLHMSFVYSIPGHVFRNGKCDPIGLPCKIPKRQSNRNKTKWTWQCCNGVYIEILQRIIKEIKVSFELYIVEDGGWGSSINGSWNGMIHDVITGKADIALQQLNVSPERLQFVDFTQPVAIKRDYVGIVIRKENSAKSIFDWSSTQSMTLTSFVTLLLATAVVLTAIFLLEYVGYRYEYNKRYSFRDSFSYVNGLLFQRDLGAVLPRRWPGQIVAILFAYGTTILVGLFTAEMTATNITEGEVHFEGFKDKVFQDPSYILGVRGNDHYGDVALSLDLKAKKVRISELSEGIESVRNKSIDAYVWQSLELEYMLGTKKQWRNELFLFSEKISGSSDVAFAMQKGSRIGIVISKFILHMTESGDLQRILDGWSVHLKNKVQGTKSTNFIRYPLEYGLSLAFVLGCSAIFCVFLLMLENWVTNIKSKSTVTPNI